MKLRLFAVLTVLMMALVACQNTDNGDMNPNDTEGDVEPTRYQGHNMGDDARNQGRDHTLERVSDRNNDRDADYNVSKEAADKITEEMDNIDHAYVLTTKNNAYVGANLDTDNDEARRDNDNGNGMEVTDEVKDKIADIVRSVDPSIDHVHVTTNPDFLDLADRYVNDMDNGNPVEGFFDQIGNMIDRVFPDTK
ncbi:YhcN/YlaJ family sporulation lipoprotein [Oceanobacillus sojae]|uniref:YhcN/YlaJ family sporulation lipoprotein n=1 Tax=Oceanobacillus sojae TaxID=582851 RepID=UPI0021A82930|nr:YhcN/YlaJ family sporulation lipoprotein [Oceanobacillus sojae]MCT1903161.1 YhcN/YlaJ family sporulation lipoprotein [Oceanobacillus sojae]